MAEAVKLGEPIELDITLENSNPLEPKFVRVILKDRAGVALSQSPVSLTDQGGGRHFNDSVAKPIGSVSAFYEVFEDAGFVTRDDNFEDATERYIDPPFSSAFVEGPRVSAIISQDRISGKIQVNTISATVGQSEAIIGEISSDEISGKLEQNNISGSVEC